MENRDLVYELAKKLDMIIEVTKKGEYIGKYRFINEKLHKLNDEPESKDMQNLQKRENKK
jgi:hypothetical protein